MREKALNCRKIVDNHATLLVLVRGLCHKSELHRTSTASSQAPSRQVRPVVSQTYAAHTLFAMRGWLSMNPLHESIEQRHGQLCITIPWEVDLIPMPLASSASLVRPNSRTNLQVFCDKSGLMRTESASAMASRYAFCVSNNHSYRGRKKFRPRCPITVLVDLVMPSMLIGDTSAVFQSWHPYS